MNIFIMYPLRDGYLEGGPSLTTRAQATHIFSYETVVTQKYQLTDAGRAFVKNWAERDRLCRVREPSGCRGVLPRRRRVRFSWRASATAAGPASFSQPNAPPSPTIGTDRSSGGVAGDDGGGGFGGVVGDLG
jgi:hypothetical protein